jgi:anti-sigma regulatory factor (Ser/Thr protein kinase)
VEPTDGDSIKLTVPATAAAVRITRVGAAGVATRAGFTYREGEEVRLAVGEAAALLALGEGQGEESRGTLVVTYTLGGAGLSVELRVEGDRVGPMPVTDLPAALLDASVDAWEASDGGRRIVLHKHHADAEEDED